MSYINKLFAVGQASFSDRSFCLLVQ